LPASSFSSTMQLALTQPSHEGLGYGPPGDW
jgi:hypothetical protein